MSEQLRQLRRAVRLVDATPENRAFVATVREELAPGETLTLHLLNPSDSEKVLDVYRFVVATQFRADFTIYDQLGGSVSGGTIVTPDSLYMDANGEAPAASVATLNTGVTFDDTQEPHLESVVPSGGVGGGAMGGTAEGTEPDMDPGRELVLEVENTAESTTAKTALGVVYIEQ